MNVEVTVIPPVEPQVQIRIAGLKNYQPLPGGIELTLPVSEARIIGDQIRAAIAAAVAGGPGGQGPGQ